MNTKLVKFYNGTSSDDYGRTFNDILKWDDSRLESCHNYIQWLFPLETESKYNLSSPLLDDETIIEFNNSILLKDNARRAFNRMIAFFKLDDMLQETNGNVNFALHWVTPNNHNFLRITSLDL